MNLEEYWVETNVKGQHSLSTYYILGKDLDAQAHSILFNLLNPSYRIDSVIVYNLTNEQKSNYNPGTSTDGRGYEDDDDYEDLYLYQF